MKKYEIYLPLKYNDGSEIEPEKFKQIRELGSIWGFISGLVLHCNRCVIASPGPFTPF